MKKLILLIALILLAIPADLSAQDHKVTCPQCNGRCKIVTRCSYCHNGAVICSSCRGLGTTSTRCSNCSNGYVNKSSRITCSSCRGAGTTKVPQSKPCTCRGGKVPSTSRGGNTIYINCSRCNGTGSLTSYVDKYCSACRGSGYTVRSERVKCSYCNNGVISTTCSNCKGRRAVPCTNCKGYANIEENCSRCRGLGYVFVAD